MHTPKDQSSVIPARICGRCFGPYWDLSSQGKYRVNKQSGGSEMSLYPSSHDSVCSLSTLTKEAGAWKANLAIIYSALVFAVVVKTTAVVVVVVVVVVATLVFFFSLRSRCHARCSTRVVTVTLALDTMMVGRRVERFSRSPARVPIKISSRIAPAIWSAMQPRSIYLWNPSVMKIFIMQLKNLSITRKK